MVLDDVQLKVYPALGGVGDAELPAVSLVFVSDEVAMGYSHAVRGV